MNAKHVAWSPMLLAAAVLAVGLTAPRVEALQRAVPRGGGDSPSGGSGGGAPQGARPSPSSAPEGRSPSSGPAPTSAPSPRDGNTGSQQAGNSGYAYARPRAGNSVNGAAVQRVGPPPPPPGGGPWGPNYYYYPYYPYYPWGFGGFSFGAYFYGGFSFGPYFYGGFYDPWWYYGYPLNYSQGFSGDGSVRLKIKPSTAAVFVDGYFAGRVEDFDGSFQRLHVDPGPHRIDVRGDGYDTLSFDVRVLPDRTITYSGELKADGGAPAPSR